MSRLITVIGATGSQGGSVIRALLHHPDYSLRAVTRNSGRDAMRQQIDASAGALAPVLHEIPGLIRDLRSA